MSSESKCEWSVRGFSSYAHNSKAIFSIVCVHHLTVYVHHVSSFWGKFSICLISHKHFYLHSAHGPYVVSVTLHSSLVIGNRKCDRKWTCAMLCTWPNGVVTLLKICNHNSTCVWKPRAGASLTINGLGTGSAQSQKKCVLSVSGLLLWSWQDRH